ncbi:ADP-ribose pyrophosphatase [Parelusimicrobium proximum]|uniref:NUDIX domain-containing protein n=1 Tax=Parelusimicrobium proximum TaxID=3228953 RepID=UPI003D16F658
MTYYSKLKETKVSSKQIHRGVIGFNIDTVRLIDGRTATREYLVHAGASAVLPITDKGEIVLVQQYRYPIGCTTWELPAGKIEKGQTPLSCAKAELEQEAGYKAVKLKKMLTFFPCCAFSNEILHIYKAENLKPGKQHLDKDEFLNVKKFTMKQIDSMFKKGQIVDAKTIIALSLYKNDIFKKGNK